MTTSHNSQLLETSLETETVIPSSTPEHGPGIGFFAVGLVINIALIIAFFVWAYRQGRKKDE